MKKPMIMSTLGMLVAALLICGGTHSYFSDSAYSSDNWFHSGNMNLKIRDQNEPWSESVSATWTRTNMKPGEEMPFNTINDAPFVDLKNIGSIPGSKLDIHVVNSVQGGGGPAADEMDKFMEITRMEYSDSFPTMDLLSYISDVNGNGWQDLDDLEQSYIADLPPMAGTGHFDMGLRFRTEAGNAFQGKTLVADFTFTLRQH